MERATLVTARTPKPFRGSLVVGVVSMWVSADASRSGMESKHPLRKSMTSTLPQSLTTSRRTGARRPSLVPEEVLYELQLGHIETSNLMEQIALDMAELLTNAFPSLCWRREELHQGGLVTRMRTGGMILLEGLGRSAITDGQKSESDTIRGWAAMAVGLLEDL